MALEGQGGAVLGVSRLIEYPSSPQANQPRSDADFSLYVFILLSYTLVVIVEIKVRE